MNLKLIGFFAVFIFVLNSLPLSAQQSTKDEYLAEVGVNAGVGYYLGETNSQLFGNVRETYSAMFRYKLNPRIAFRAELSSATVMGAGIKANPVYIGDVCGEFNFFELEQNKYKRLSKTYSPYIFVGLSLFTDVVTKQKLPEVGIPFGLGFKVKLNNRFNLNAQWATRLLLSDNLEGYIGQFDNPYGLNGTNVFNNDLLSTFTVGVSYDIWKKPCDCKNSNKKK